MKEDREISLYLISDIGRVYRKGCQMPLVTHLAYLRYFAENTEEREHADETILQEFLQEIVIEKEMLLPFTSTSPSNLGAYTDAFAISSFARGM